MTVVTFNTSTLEVVHVQCGIAANVTPERIAIPFLTRHGLSEEDYTTWRIPEDLTYFEFLQRKQVTPTGIEDVVLTDDARQLLLYKSIVTLCNETAHKNGGWYNIYNAIAAAGVPNTFQAQATTLTLWWSSVWEYYFKMLNDVQQGLRVLPSVEVLQQELPQFQR